MEGIDTSWFEPAAKLWYERQVDADNVEYNEGEFVSFDSKTNNVKLTAKGQALELPVTKIYQYSEIQVGNNDDLVQIETLNDASLLHNIRDRTEKDDIYMYCGPTLIAMNPFRMIPKLFGKDSGQKEKFIAHSLNTENQERIHPHIWSTATQSFKQLFFNNRKQAIVISGESGAGKTENNKFIMAFLVDLCGGAIPGQITIGDKILATNPILEAFGNSKTCRNNNSSRFGKYIWLYFNDKKISGARMKNYLLEKSRIIAQGKDERNYHFFYSFYGGVNPSLYEQLKMINPKTKKKWELSEFEICNKSGCYSLASGEPVPFEETEQAFKDLGFSESETITIYKITQAVLLIGNFTFQSVDNAKEYNKISSTDILKDVCDLLEVDMKEFEYRIVSKTTIVGKDVSVSKLDIKFCQNEQTAIAKELYNRMFNWLVYKLNQTLLPKGVNYRQLISIGILDIFGFEVFEVNTLEQLCINFANEKLQQLYIGYVFKGEAKIFENEGLLEFVASIKFKDNQGVIDTLDKSKPQGIYQILDGTTRAKKGDLDFLRDIFTVQKGNPLVNPHKKEKNIFVIVHTAKTVNYAVDNFIDKNNDSISIEISACCQQSKNQDFLKIFAIFETLQAEEDAENPPEPGKKDGAKKTLGMNFRQQINDLCDELASSECQFVRCLKPNEVKKPCIFWQGMVMNQIKYLGIQDSIKVKKSAYPVRLKFENFYQKYAALDGNFKSLEQNRAANLDFKTLCQNLFKVNCPLGEDDLLFGKTMVFLRQTGMNSFITIYKQKLQGKIQGSSTIKGWFRKMKKINILKNTYNSSQKLINLQKLKVCQQRMVEKYQKYVFVKNEMARFNTKLLDIKCRRFAVIIQKHIRRYLAVKKYRNMKKGVILIENQYLEYKANKKKIILRIIKELVSQYALNKSWQIISNKAADVIKQKYYNYYIKSIYSKEIKEIKHMKQKFKMSKGVQIIKHQFRFQQTFRNINKIYKSVTYIQAFVKMKIVREWFLTQKSAVLTIERIIGGIVQKLKDQNDVLQAYMNQKQQELTENNNLDNYDENYQQNNYQQSSMRKESAKTLQGKNKTKKPQVLLDISEIKSNAPQDENSSPMKIISKIKNVKVEQLSMEQLQLINQKFMQDYERTNNSPRKTNNSSKKSSVKFPQNKQKVTDIVQFTEILSNKDGYTKNKAEIIMLPIDLDITNGYFFDGKSCLKKFTQNYESIFQQFHESDSILSICSQSNASIATTLSGKIYSIDSNEQISLSNNVDQISSGDQHTLILNKDNTLVAYGEVLNQKITADFNYQKITELFFNDHKAIFKEHQVMTIGCKGNKSFIITSNNRALFWPKTSFQEYVQEQQFRLQQNAKNLQKANPKNMKQIYECQQEIQKIQLYENSIELVIPGQKICQIGMGYNFIVILTKSGLVYSMGVINTYGQLGHGHTNAVYFPTLVEGLKNEKIVMIQCGHSHVVVKNIKNQIFTWGQGRFGQLGHESYSNQLVPKILSLSKLNLFTEQVKTFTVSYKATLIITMNFKIFWFGTNSIIQNINYPIEADLTKIIKGFPVSKNLIPIKFQSNWNKSISNVNVIFGDLRNLQGVQLKMQQNMIEQIQQKWEEINPEIISMPYLKHFSMHFYKRFMLNNENVANNNNNHDKLKKYQVPKYSANVVNAKYANNLNNQQQQTNSSQVFQQQQLSLQQSQQYITPNKFDKNGFPRYSIKPQEQPQSKEIQIIYGKAYELKNKEKHLWNSDDYEFVKLLENSPFDDLKQLFKKT